MVQVAEINDVVGEIAAGAKEQAIGLAEVNTAINQMDQVTQQNAAMVEESTAASHSLSQETEQLSDLIGQFKIGRVKDVKPMRRETRAAPHVLRPAAKATAARKPQARPANGGLKAVVNGAPVGDDSGWEEF